MEVIHARNVSHAYQAGRKLLDLVGVRQSSRAGDVLVAPHPVVTVYDRPDERVLFDEARNANPFFHLFESLWMLAGRADAAYLNQFVRDFGERFAEPEDGMIWGAYGRRWRNWFEQDQIETAIAMLDRNPDDRRVVISMWDPSMDLDVQFRDIPCNTHIYPRVRYEDNRVDLGNGNIGGEDGLVLDLTVLCRSNDVIWGAYGANAVHFSVLLEYLAARLGVGIGKMYQFSNNWHGYVDALEKHPSPVDLDDPYTRRAPQAEVRPQPMFTVPSEADHDIRRFLEKPHDSIYGNKWFHTTAAPMLHAHECWRNGAPEEALRYSAQIEASDWRMAVQRWLARRRRS